MAAVLPWGEEDPAEIERFRAELRAAFGERPPRVLDPFAGGGAIPLEAMRLGCEAAADLNPVAWFLPRCTLRYPRALAAARRPLPGFAVEERAFSHHRRPERRGQDDVRHAGTCRTRATARRSSTETSSPRA